MEAKSAAKKSKNSSPGAITSSNAFYYSVLESIEDYAVFTTDKDGLVNSWNTGAEHLLGYSEKEIMNQNCAILFTDADVETSQHIHELQSALKRGSAIDERFHVHKNGSRFWGSGKVFPLYDNHKQHIGFTKIMRNLTDRQRAEERLQKARHYAESIVESAVEPIIMLNEDLTINTMNKAFFDHYNIKKKKVFDTPFAALANGGFNTPEFKALLKELKSGPGYVYSKELTHEFKQRGKRILIINGRKLHPDVNMSLLMLSVQDITEQRALEQQKDDFISIASHEIRTPLTVIKATAQLLYHRFHTLENGAVGKSAAKIDEKADKLLTLIHYLLDASQIARGELMMKPELFSITDLVIESIDEMMLINPGLTIISKGKIKNKVWGDRFRISQVLNNLLNNAVKYSPRDKDIIVSVTKNKNGGNLIVSVQDFGIGIPKQEQKNLFKRFWRASTARQKDISGIGLGLHISSQIIEKHNGKLWFISDKNKGSTFKFSIPLKAVSI